MATAKPTTKKPAARAVVVTTKDRGIFFGYIADETKAPDQITLSQCRNCVYYPQAVKGFLGLAVSGPTSGSRIGPAALSVTLFGLTSVVDASADAVKAWEAQPWS